MQSDLIFIVDGNLPIEDSDIAIRILPSGVVEEYIILDKGFHKGIRQIPDHYQMSVRRKGTTIPDQRNEHINFTADNGAKVFINSSDHSVNMISDINVFEDLIKELKKIDDVQSLEEVSE